MQEVLARAPAVDRRVLRFFGTPESAVAKALEEAGGDGGGVTATICAREFEIHVDLVVDPGAEARADAIADALRGSLGRHLFGEDERHIAEIVLDLGRERGLTIAAAESCTGGLVSARLTAIPGASEVFVGGVVSYADEVKESALGVPREILERHGAVSAETAKAMAEGVRERLGADVGVAVTGVAGPDGGTAEKPVGLVFVHASRSRRREGQAHGPPRRPRHDPGTGDGGRAASRSQLVAEPAHARVKGGGYRRRR